MSTSGTDSSADSGGDEIPDILNNFTLDRGGGRRAAHVTARSDESGAGHVPRHEGSPFAQWPDPEFSHTAGTDSDEPLATAIRPYAWTGGRTRSKHLLEIETLVSTRGIATGAGGGRLEHESVAELCREPRSVAEVGALLGLPIGVVKVLLGDMADLGLVSVHDTVSGSGSESHLLLMERVLSGLRRL